MIHLQTVPQLLARDIPGKVGGPPGNAFELVYSGATDAVRKKMHAVDPVLSEYIRCASACWHSDVPCSMLFT